VNIPGFAAEASLYRTNACFYLGAEANSSSPETKVSPQQVIPPGLRCLFDYWACNSSCSSWPIWRRNDCYSYCFAFYNRCLHPVSG
jgi:hypothetical protein